MKKVIDLFCGAGGFSHGFQEAGFEIVLGIDNDPTVIDTFRANHPDADFILSDMRHVREDMLESYAKPDVLIGSPPCVDFSLINTDRDPKGKGMELVKEYLRIRDILDPSRWILENVSESEPFIRSLIPSAKYAVLDAVDFGAPQFRKRVFFGDFLYPIPTHCEMEGQMTLFGSVREKWRTLREVVDFSVNYGFIGPEREAKLIRLKNTRVSGNDVRIGTVPYPDPLDRPSRTLLAKISKVNRNTIVIEVPEGKRLISLKERARIQGFPDSFRWFGTTSHIERHIGNAVPPPLSKALALPLL